jgi:hypothetical protein
MAMPMMDGDAGDEWRWWCTDHGATRPGWLMVADTSENSE